MFVLGEKQGRSVDVEWGRRQKVRDAAAALGGREV